MSSRTSEAASDVHLLVLVHGLWGSPSHLDFVAKSIRTIYPSEDDLHILITKNNSSSLTYDGVDTGGERVTDEVEKELQKLEEEGKTVTKMSVVGYSLGGLIARFAIGLLHSKGWFEKITPVNFTTFATPHLGVRAPVAAGSSSIFNSLGERTLSVSGHQMFIVDSFRDTGRPLLAVLADPQSVFIKALASFRHRSLYANIVNDRAVPFYTACILPIDPFAALPTIDIHYEPSYSDVILKSPPNMASLKAQPLTYYESMSHGFKSAMNHAPFYFFLTLIGPFAGAFYFANSGVQSFKSAQRIKEHEEGKAGIAKGLYKLPVMLENAGKKVEDTLEGVSAQEDAQDLLSESDQNLLTKTVSQHMDDAAEAQASNGHPPEATNEDQEGHAKQGERGANNGEKEEGDSSATDREQGFPTLALTSDQFQMIENLDSVGFQKYPVHIHNANHSHAAIIVRMQRRPGFGEGKVVARHWTERFEL